MRGIWKLRYYQHTLNLMQPVLYRLPQGFVEADNVSFDSVPIGQIADLLYSVLRVKMVRALSKKLDEVILNGTGR